MAKQSITRRNPAATSCKPTATEVQAGPRPKLIHQQSITVNQAGEHELTVLLHANGEARAYLVYEREAQQGGAQEQLSAVSWQAPGFSPLEQKMEGHLRNTLQFLESHMAILNCCISALLSIDKVSSKADVIELLDGEIAHPERFGEHLAQLRDFVQAIDNARGAEAGS